MFGSFEWLATHSVDTNTSGCAYSDIIYAPFCYGPGLMIQPCKTWMPPQGWRFLILAQSSAAVEFVGAGLGVKSRPVFGPLAFALIFALPLVSTSISVILHSVPLCRTTTQATFRWEIVD